jgi:thioredoxin-like negative regulator of GroEL
VAPVVNRLKKEYQGKVEIVQIDVDKTENAELTAKYNINAIPTFIFLDKSGNVVDKAVGALQEEALKEKIEKLLQ